MAVTDFSWASMTPATNCWTPFSTFACASGVAVAVAVRAVRAVRAAAGLRLRDFEVVRLREAAAVLRVRGFAAVLARGFGLAAALGLAGVGVGVVGLAGVGVDGWADVVLFDDSAGFASV